MAFVHLTLRGGGDLMTTSNTKPAVTAYRKACKPTGIGLSHYVLVVNRPVQKPQDETDVR